MKIVFLLNVAILTLALLMLFLDLNELCFIPLYISNIILAVYAHRCHKKCTGLYLKHIDWLIALIIMLSLANILVAIFHEDVKWVARPFFWALGLSYFVLFFVMGYANLEGKAKLAESVYVILIIIMQSLIATPLYPYYRLSYSMRSENNILKYEHIADGLTETTTYLTQDSAIYIKTIKDPQKIITIHYEAYPHIIARADTIHLVE